MFTPEKKKLDPKSYEQVKINALIAATITAIEYKDDHQFPGYKGNPPTIDKAVRIKMTLEGYEFPRTSGWLRFSNGEKASLYKKYLVPLVEGIKPDAKFDLDHLIGMKVQLMFIQNKEYQNINVIVPADKPLGYTDQPATAKESMTEEQVPF